MNVTTRNRLIIGAAFVIAGSVIAYQMFHAMTPPRHADHDHAMATLDAGGFLWVEEVGGDRRNLVGRPGKVVLLHWFDPSSGEFFEEAQAARFAAGVADDPMVEVLLIAVADERDELDTWAAEAGVPLHLLYFDEGGRTSELIGVRRLPESLIYDPTGRMAHQARGLMDWSAGALGRRIEAAKRGVEEIE
jgi:hypothetical protein